jgi:multidrug efflux system membrane fusion protein
MLSGLACFSLVLLMPFASPKAQGGPPAPSVTIAAPLAKRITNWDEYTGRFEAIESVEIRPRVSGYIDSISFTDGQVVKKGDLLFTIDPRPYQIAVDSARADVTKSRAQVVFTTADYDRGVQLVDSRTVPVKDLEQRRANLDTARAQAVSADAALRNAELNLEWTQVRAPLGGRISDHRISIGNLVSGGQADASEADYIRYTRLAASGQRPSSRDIGAEVQVRLADERGWPHRGNMNFVDNQLNARSGTIRGRAVFDNKDLFLTPGTFGRLRLSGGQSDGLLIPDSAIVSDQAHKIVMTVGADNKVVPKPVTLGAINLGLRVVLSGLTKDDKVIIAGLASPFVRPGAVVVPEAGEIKPIETTAASN